MANSPETPVVEPALEVADADAVNWDETADVVIVGFGSAGATAALTAREGGADVLVIDRFGGGGATRWSGGVIYGGATRFQKEAGVQDDADNMYNYLSQEKMSVAPETLRRFCEESGPQIEWLADHGVGYSGALFPHPAPYPPDPFYLYPSGNEHHPAYAANAAPAARGHRAVGPGLGGIHYFTALRKSVDANGIRFMPHSPVRRLIVDATGTVLGVETLVIPEAEQAAHAAIDGRIVPLSPTTAGKAEKAVKDVREFEARFTERRRVRARAGVIIAAGGFAYNLEKVAQRSPVLARAHAATMRLGTLGDDGAGIDLGKSAGGTTHFMDSFFIGRSLAPPAGTLRGCMVNMLGERFIAEDRYNTFLGAAMEQQPDGKAWLILDNETYRAVRHEALFPAKGLRLFTLPTLLTILFGGHKKAGSIEKLAGKIGVPAAALTRTIDGVRTQSAAGKDDLGKTAANIAPFGDGPYHALNVSIGYRFAPTMVFSMGGLKVDETSGEVLREDGTTIRHLYAAGRTAAGLMSAADINGMSIADTVFSGRRAGRHAATRTNAPPVG